MNRIIVIMIPVVLSYAATSPRSRSFRGARTAEQADFTDTEKFHVLAADGGLLGRVDETSHMNTRNGTYFDFIFGRCSTPQ